MSELLERIKEAYILETDAEVAEFLDLNPSTLSMQKNRGRLNLKRIIEKCSDLNKNWLLEGEGPIWKKELDTEVIEIPIFSSLALRESSKPDFQNSLTEGNILIDISDGSEDLIAPTDHLIGYTIPGDAMAPILRKHDIAFFDLKSRAPKDDAIFLISVDHKIMCRRIEESEGEYIIRGKNHEQDIIEMSKTNIDYTIIGEMIWMLRTNII